MDGWMEGGREGGREGGGRRRFNLTRLSKSSFTELDENEAADQPTESDGRTDGRVRRDVSRSRTMQREAVKDQPAAPRRRLQRVYWQRVSYIC